MVKKIPKFHAANLNQCPLNIMQFLPQLVLLLRSFGKFTTFISNSALTLILTTYNNVTSPRISKGNFALNTAVISQLIYMCSTSSSSPCSSFSNIGIETWVQNLITSRINPSSSRIFNFSRPLSSQNFSPAANLTQSPPVILNLPSFWKNNREL